MGRCSGCRLFRCRIESMTCDSRHTPLICGSGNDGAGTSPFTAAEGGIPSCDIVPCRMSDQAKTAVDVALLAPVPLVHLRSGREKCNQVGRVAFASDDFRTFRE